MNKINLTNVQSIFLILIIGGIFLTSATSTKYPVSGGENMSYYYGQVRLFGGNFPPKGWEACNGSIIANKDNPNLFSVLKYTYGGNGVDSFALPDLRGRVIVHSGTGSGLSHIKLGQKGGSADLKDSLVEIEQDTIGGGGVVNVSANMKEGTNYQPSLKMNYIICTGDKNNIPFLPTK